MFAFLTTPVPRTPIAHLKSIPFENGRSRMEFHTTPNGPYPAPPASLMTLTLPPRASEAEVKSGKAYSEDNNIMPPPYHYHPVYPETFTVSRGSLKVIIDGSPHVVNAPDKILVPRYASHRFMNASFEEPLVVGVRFEDSEQQKGEERFFRNVYGYLGDCEKMGPGGKGGQPNIAQLLLFCVYSGTVLAFPGPRWIGQPLGRAFQFIVGKVIGEWLLGFKSSYPEYYKEETE